jgi:hypothetical protein
MQLLALSKNPHGYRVHFLGARVHHGLIGLLMLSWGAFLMLKDAHDFPWLSDY